MTTTAVLVTRGDVDLMPILDSLPFDQIIIWDNSKGLDLSVYGRHVKALDVKTPWVYTQDDDCILDPESFHALLDAWRENVIVSNTPERFRDGYPEQCLLGFGAVYRRDVPAQAFARFDATAHGITEESFRRDCDLIVTGLSERVLIDVPFSHREFASDASRLWRQPDHSFRRKQMLDLVRQVRDAA